jgi:hypothetical protein
MDKISKEVDTDLPEQDNIYSSNLCDWSFSSWWESGYKKVIWFRSKWAAWEQELHLRHNWEFRLGDDEPEPNWIRRWKYC